MRNTPNRPAAARFSSALLLVVGLVFGGTQSAAADVRVNGSNKQNVTVQGSVNNKASGGGKAVVNIGSVSGRNVSTGSNSQSVHVSGSINNEAGGRGSKAEVNIGSVTDSSP